MEGKFLRPSLTMFIDEKLIILLDSAQTPLIILGSPRVHTNYYAIIDTLVTTLVEKERIISLKRRKRKFGTTIRGPSAENFL